MFSYLRDTHQAQTVGEAWDCLAQRRVDFQVVKLWVDEKMAVDPGVFDAIAEGYPELKTELQKARDTVTKRDI